MRKDAPREEGGCRSSPTKVILKTLVQATLCMRFSLRECVFKGLTALPFSRNYLCVGTTANPTRPSYGNMFVPPAPLPVLIMYSLFMRVCLYFLCVCMCLFCLCSEAIHYRYNASALLCVHMFQNVFGTALNSIFPTSKHAPCLLLLEYRDCLLCWGTVYTPYA